MSADQQRAVPPHNLEAEQCVLGSILTDRLMLDEVVGIVAPEDFYDPQHERIFRTMLDLARTEQPIDAITLAERDHRLSADAKAEKFSYYALLRNIVPSAASASYYAKIVHEKAALRGIIGASGKMAAAAYSGESDVEAAFAQAETAWRNACEHKSGAKGALDLPEALKGNYYRVSDLTYGEVPKKAQETPWKGLNEMIGAFCPGNVVVWAGAAKAGKSGVALNLADYVAHRYGDVMYSSVELMLPEMVMRYVALYSGVSAMRQVTGDLNESHLERICEANGVIANRPVHFYGRTQTGSIAEIRSELRALQRTKCVVTLIVDGINCLRDCGGINANATLNERMDAIYREFLQIAGEYEVVVHLVTHLNRKGQDRGRPEARDVRDGGNAEGHASAVIIPWRPNPNSDVAAEREEGEFIIAAARCGSQGTVPMRFKGGRGLWMDKGDSRSWFEEQPKQPDLLEQLT